MLIESEWQYEKGKWDKETCQFIDRTFSKLFIKEIKIKIFLNILSGKETVQFVGGPTGFESYFLEDLENHDLNNTNKFCICGGTINSWARCTVRSKDIYNAIKQYKEML